MSEVADAWNEENEVGTLVRYWTGPLEGEGKLGRTRSPAQDIASQQGVVWIEGHAGCVLLSHVRVAERAAENQARAARGKRALEMYAQQAEPADRSLAAQLANGDYDECLVDLFADLLHFLGDQKLSYERIMRLATDNYHGELDDESEEARA